MVATARAMAPIRKASSAVNVLAADPVTPCTFVCVYMYIYKYYIYICVDVYIYIYICIEIYINMYTHTRMKDSSAVNVLAAHLRCPLCLCIYIYSS